MSTQEKKHESPVDGTANNTTATESPEPSQPQRKSLSFYLSFLALLIMVFIVSLDTTTLAVALPIIAHDLDGSTLEAFWANICFMLAVVVVQPLYMSTSDVLGRKIPLYTAFLLFFAGSLVFALAPNMTVVIVGRTIQGLGGSGLDVLNEIITADMTTLKERPTYLGILALPMAAGALLGPIVGALLSEFVSWRWIGWINLPLTGLGFFLILVNLRLKPLEGSFLSKARRLDLAGMFLFTAGATAFILPLSWAGSMYAWGSWRTLLPLVMGLVILGVFAIYEHRPEYPVMPYRLFTSITAVTSFFGAFLHGVVVYNLNTYMPLLIQAVFKETPLKSAITLLPMNIVSLVFSVLSPVAVGHLRRYLGNIWLGWIFLTLGVGLLALIDRGASVAFRTGLPVVVSVGIGVLFTVLNLPVQASVPTAEDQGLGVGLVVFLRLFGGLVGLALGSTIFNSVFEKSITTLGPLPDSIALLSDSSKAVSFIPQLRSPHADVPATTLIKVLTAYGKSFRTIWLVMIGFAGLGLVLSFFTKEETMENEELGRQHFEHS